MTSLPVLGGRLCFDGTAQRRYSQGVVVVPRRFAGLLGLELGDVVVERTITLIVNGEPLLASTSYLPIGLADARPWQQVGVGELALDGHAVSAEFVEAWTRMATPAERATLAMPMGGAVTVLSLPYQILLGERTVPAGVIVLARDDRVGLRWGRA